MELEYPLVVRLARKCVLWNVHRVGAGHHRGGIEAEGNAEVISSRCGRVRRSSVHREITRIDCARIDRVRQVNRERSRRSASDQAAAGRVGGGHGKANQLPVGKGILLGLGVNRYAPVHP